LAKHAEELGFHSIQLPQVPVLPYPEERPPHGGMAAFIPDELRHYQFDPLVLVPIITQATSRIRVGFNIAVTPYLHPYIWAKYMASLDAASNGRLIAGFGLGFVPPGGSEVIALSRLGIEGKQRGKMSDEALKFITRLWTEDTPIDEDGSFFKLRRLVVDPKPLQRPYPELWWAGDSDPAVERAARFADYLELTWPPASRVRERFAPALKKANDKWCRNTKIADIIYAEVTPQDLSPDEIAKRWHGGYMEEAHAVGTPAAVAATILKLRDAGVSHFALDMHRHGQDHISQIHNRMQKFVEEVVPILR
jgi:alkanesulfonate monooxygenase SsuD/methylene tetrahydromethanopterin reductase-like flavin-dependent oxidoreductase (luciferase family)